MGHHKKASSRERETSQTRWHPNCRFCTMSSIGFFRYCKIAGQEHAMGEFHSCLGDAAHYSVRKLSVVPFVPLNQDEDPHEKLPSIQLKGLPVVTSY